MNLTGFLYEIKKRRDIKENLAITRLGKSIKFSECTNSDPKLLHSIKVLLSLNNLPFKEKQRKFVSSEKQGWVWRNEIIADGLRYNDLECLFKLNSKLKRKRAKRRRQLVLIMAKISWPNWCFFTK